MWTIGIDIGTTTISGVVVRTENNVPEKSYTIANDSFFETAYAWERLQNPDIIIKKSMELLDKILLDYPQTDVIGLTGQMHGIVYLNRQGKHVSPLYTWQDGSGSQSCMEGMNVCEYAEKSYGVKLYTGYGLATYLYHAVTGRVPEKAAVVCTIMDYLGMVLTGRTEPLIHVSNAASLGLFDAERGCFQTEILEQMKADTRVLPEVSGGMTLLGTYKGIPVSVAIGDNQASFLGTVKEIEDTLLINMGTGGQISLYVSSYHTIKGMETRPFMEEDYLLVGSSLCGGRAYALLEQFFRSYAEALGQEGEQYTVLERILNERKEQQASEKLSVATTFSGTREEPQKRGAIFNISTENFTPAAVILGVLDGMTEELYEMYKAAVPHLEKLPEKMMASGNGIRRNKKLQEIMQECFSMPMELSEQKEEAAYGAAMAGKRALEKRDVRKKEKCF